MQRMNFEGASATRRYKKGKHVVRMVNVILYGTFAVVGAEIMSHSLN